MKSDLKIGFCSFEAAKYACLNWHYAKSVPCGKSVKVGVWEKGEFKGCVFFSRGANRMMAGEYGLGVTEACELTRVALRAHEAPVSRILAIAIRLLRKQCPGLRLIVSYSDLGQNHVGGIYQAGNWVYVGMVKPAADVFIIHGKKMHRRSVSSANHTGLADGEFAKRLDPNAERVKATWKHKYLMPLDEGMKRQVEGLAKPYPKRPKQSDGRDLRHSGGAEPTRTLQPEPGGSADA